MRSVMFVILFDIWIIAALVADVIGLKQKCIEDIR